MSFVFEYNGFFADNAINYTTNLEKNKSYINSNKESIENGLTALELADFAPINYVIKQLSYKLNYILSQGHDLFANSIYFENSPFIMATETQKGVYKATSDIKNQLLNINVRGIANETNKALELKITTNKTTNASYKILSSNSYNIDNNSSMVICMNLNTQITANNADYDINCILGNNYSVNTVQFDSLFCSYLIEDNNDVYVY